jgi:hypothetical protein
MPRYAQADVVWLWLLEPATRILEVFQAQPAGGLLTGSYADHARTAVNSEPGVAVAVLERQGACALRSGTRLHLRPLGDRRGTSRFDLKTLWHVGKRRVVARSAATSWNCR